MSRSSFLSSRRRPLTRLLLLVASGALVLAPGCDRGGGLELSDAEILPDAGIPEDAPRSFPDSSISRGDLSLARVVPDHGPFSGGTTAVLRGSGFRNGDDVFVEVGGRMVQPADIELVDSRRLQIVVPAGEVGPADVVVRIGDDSITLENGYTYDALAVDPSTGSTTGGTFVNVVGSGTAFEAGDRVIFGRSECTDVEVLSPTRITCRTPPLASGTVDVTVIRAADASETRAVDAYTYYDTSDPTSGGLGGGPIRGTINITVIDGNQGTPVPCAQAILGEDFSTELQGTTDPTGRVSISGADLTGPQTLHVMNLCYERTSFVTFDAQDVTVFLVPRPEAFMSLEMIQRCFWCIPPTPPNPGTPPTGRGRNGSFIEGELIWRGPNEYPPRCRHCGQCPG